MAGCPSPAPYERHLVIPGVEQGQRMMNRFLLAEKLPFKIELLGQSKSGKENTINSNLIIPK